MRITVHDACKSKAHFIKSTTYISLRMQLNEKPPPLEAQLSNLGPRKRIDSNKVLKDEDAQVRHRQMQRNAFVILNTEYTPQWTSDE
jgi:hypothetical protein